MMNVMIAIEKKDENWNTGGEESRVCIFRTCRDSIVGKDALMKIFTVKM
jgi:hypothetical protein